MRIQTSCKTSRPSQFKSDFANANVMCHVYAEFLTENAEYISFVALVHGKRGLIYGKQDTYDLIVSALELHIVTGTCKV